MKNREQKAQQPKSFPLGVEYHYSMSCDFKVNFLRMSVDIMYREPCSDFEVLTERFGYSEKELRNDIFSFDKMMPFTEHTIHKLRNADDKTKIMQKAKNIVRSVSLAKNEIASYDIKIPIVYRHKNGSKVYVQNQYLVDWYNKTSVANIHFMNGDN